MLIRCLVDVSRSSSPQRLTSTLQRGIRCCPSLGFWKSVPLASAHPETKLTGEDQRDRCSITSDCKPMEDERRGGRGGAEERRGGREEQKEEVEKRLIGPEGVQPVVRPKSGSPSSTPLDPATPLGADPHTHTPNSGNGSPRTSRSSRKSFRLDYRLEEEVTRSQRDASGRFINPWPTWNFPSYVTILRLFLMEKNNSSVPSSKEVLDKELPVLEPFFVRSPESVGSVGSGLRVTWLGHASVLVEMDGLVVLTDPIFSQRASPVQFMGPKRYRGPPCSVDQLPRLDAVLISHSHYDHLDLASVTALNRRFGPDLRWLVPLGMLDWMHAVGCQNVIQLDWWEENCVPGHDDVTFVCTPAQHWCKRTPIDDNRTLWGSWSVLGPTCRFFFAGDTGYCSSFQEIGRRFGPFDLAAIPIGAYLPRGIMRSQHVDPEEAVKIHIDVQARHSVAIHWATFALAYEHYLEPPVRMREAMEAEGRDPAEFFTLNHGESRLLSSTQDVFD